MHRPPKGRVLLFVSLPLHCATLLPQANRKAVILGDQVRLSAVVGQHAGNDLVPYPHAARIDVPIVAHHIDQRLVSCVARAGGDFLGRQRMGQVPGTYDFEAIREDGQQNARVRNAIVAVDEGIPHGFSNHILRVFPAVDSPSAFQIRPRRRILPHEIPSLID